jgi:hypothetical protein
MARKAEQEKKIEDLKGDFPMLARMSTTSFEGPIHMSQRESRSSQPGRSWLLDAPPRVPEVV